MSSAIPAFAETPFSLLILPDAVSYQPAVPHQLLRVRHTLLPFTWHSCVAVYLIMNWRMVG